MTPQNIKDKIAKLEQTKAEIENQLQELYGLDYLEWLKENKERVTVYYNYGYFVIPYYEEFAPQGILLYIKDSNLYYDTDTKEWVCYATYSVVDDFIEFGLKIDFGGSWNANELEKYYKKRLNENLGGL